MYLMDDCFDEIYDTNTGMYPGSTDDSDIYSSLLTDTEEPDA